MALTRIEIAKRLRAAREAIGYTQTEVADKLELHRPTVSEIEAGRRAVTSEELYRFAGLYGTSVGELLSETAASISDVTAILFRGESAQAPATKLAIKQFLERCRAERELEELLNLPTVPDARPGYRVSEPSGVGDAVEQGNRVAEQERRRLGVGPEPIRSPLDLLEKQGVHIGPMYLEGETVDGLYMETDELGACVAVNPQIDKWTGFRSAFTAAHEYAHWLMRDVQVEIFKFEPHTKQLLEVRANAFAAAFLLPENGLREYCANLGLLDGDRISHLSPGDVVRAMDHFGASRTAILYRLLNLRMVDPQTIADLWGFPVMQTAKVLGIEFGGRLYIGTRLPALAIHAWRKGAISAGRAADLCERDVADFKQLVRDLGEEPETTTDVPLVGAAMG